MKYTFLLYSNENDFKDVTPADMEQQLAVFGAYIKQLQDAGVFVHTDWLQPSMTATKVSLKGGSKSIQDGPYADTKEQLGGFFVVDVVDLDAALAWAAKCPAAHYGIIEVRASAMPG
jgi:hypothetical protein